MLLWRVTLCLRHFVQAEQWCGLVSRDEPPQPAHAAITAPSVAVRTNPNSTQALNPHRRASAIRPRRCVPDRRGGATLTSPCGSVRTLPPSLNAQALVVSLGFLQADWAATPWCEADEPFRCPPHPHRDWAYPCHICAGTGRTPATSVPGLGVPLPHLHPGLGVPLPHLRRDWALVMPCDLLQPLPDSSDGNERPKDRTTVVISSDDDSEDDSDEDSGDGAGAAAASSDGCGMDEKIGRQQAEDGRNGSDSHRPAEPSHQASRPVHLGVALYLRPVAPLTAA